MSRIRQYAETVARAFVTGPGAVPDPTLTQYLSGFDTGENRVDYGEYIQTSNAVYTAARLRASLLSSLPIVAYRVGPDGRRDKVTSGPLVELLQKVNPFWTFQRLIEMTELSLCLWGSAYVFLDRGTNRRGRPLEMWWARPDRVTVVPDKENYVSHFLYQVGTAQPPIRFERDEVISPSMRSLAHSPAVMCRSDPPRSTISSRSTRRLTPGGGAAEPRAVIWAGCRLWRFGLSWTRRADGAGVDFCHAVQLN